MSRVSVVCSQVDVSASGRSLVQRSPTECDVSSGCDREAPQGRSWPGIGSKHHERREDLHSLVYKMNVTNSLQFVLQVVAAVSVFTSRNIQSRYFLILMSKYGQ